MRLDSNELQVSDDLELAHAWSFFTQLQSCGAKEYFILRMLALRSRVIEDAVQIIDGEEFRQEHWRVHIDDTEYSFRCLVPYRVTRGWQVINGAIGYMTLLGEIVTEKIDTVFYGK